MRALLGIVLLAACSGGPKAPAAPVGECPPNVTAAVSREHPDATQKRCKAAHENGVNVYEVTLETLGGISEQMTLSPDGDILEVEEVIATTALPRPVAEAFLARYPDGKPERVERVTPRGKAPTFEIAFGARTAMFTETGVLIEEHAAEADDNEAVGDRD